MASNQSFHMSHMLETKTAILSLFLYQGESKVVNVCHMTITGVHVRNPFTLARGTE